MLDDANPVGRYRVEDASPTDGVVAGTAGKVAGTTTGVVAGTTTGVVAGTPGMDAREVGRERIRPGLGIIEPCLPSPAKAPPSR